MKKPLKISLLRILIPVLFVVLTVAGTVWHLGWGTVCSFGWKEIAAVCPLGALETMLAQGTVLPRAGRTADLFCSGGSFRPLFLRLSLPGAVAFGTSALREKRRQAPSRAGCAR